MALLVADQVAEQMMNMLKIEDAFLLDTLINLGEADKLTIEILFERLHDNSQTLGNLALVLRNAAVHAVEEIVRADQLLQKERSDG